ncbi:hypothetical protein [Litoreibacter janthinus]|uniref:DUF2946 domain-containing protein n=1 Tax=Litoreibacter janthinus TaxID=670154 RepID=A0A1I6HP82_9RHOB|nr:hypothetical protein [Litoreibacter janthinus]SFR56259.1 hypothetical protein SAMN04488002_3225 [Litoreibacter janthinus]
MTLFRHLFAAFVMLTMVATTGSMAVMRDRDAGTHAMVICNGAGLQTILLDANGDEAEPAPICPDCTMVLLAEGPLEQTLVLLGNVRTPELVALQTSQSYIRLDKSDLKARAPPVG